MDTIHQFKYNEKTRLAGPLGRLLFAAYTRYFSENSFDVIIPVPLHLSKLRSRGFNQALLLLAEWPLLFDKSGSSRTTIDSKGKIMKRKKKTDSQTGLGRKLRKKNIKGAFAVEKASSVKGKQVLVVDDVYTTGATSHECAYVLMKNGAVSVHILTLARAD
jgi:ComF family protein